MQDLQDIFSKIWPSVRALAKDIGEEYDTVLRWRLRGRIPEEHFEKLIQKAAIREHFITAGQLLAANKKPGRRGRPRDAHRSAAS